MAELRVCFEVNGLAVDENGTPCPAGMQLSFGETEKQIDYAKLTENISIPELLKLAALDTFVKIEDVRIITPEEYDEQYGSADR